MSDILTKDIDTFKKGVISSFAPIRTPDEALHEGTNIILIDNGIVRPRGVFYQQVYLTYLMILKW